MSYSTAIFIIIGLALCTNGQEQQPPTDAPAIMDKVQDIINTPGLNETAWQQVDNVKQKIKEKCEKNGGSYDQLVAAKDEAANCLQVLMNVTQLQDEIEKAKPHGELDSVFQKYCMKNDTLLKCMTDFISVVEPCLESEERENVRTLPDVTKSFLNFICHKEGDRIALFIAAGGPECFQQKQNAIQDCFNGTFGSSIPAIDGNVVAPSFETLPSLLFSLQQCNNMAKLQDCIVKELEKCDDPTPGNMADALLNFVKNATPCHEILQGHVNAVIASDLEGGKFRSSASTFMNAYPIVLVLSFVMLKYV